MTKLGAVGTAENCIETLRQPMNAPGKFYGLYTCSSLEPDGQMTFGETTHTKPSSPSTPM